MNINKLYTLFDYISLGSLVTDCPLEKQSPDYICDKFKQYIGEFDNFEFPTISNLDLNDDKFINEYMLIWGDSRSLPFNKNIKNLLIFLNRANWDSGTLPSRKLEIFKEYIGDYSNIKEHKYRGEGLHTNLNEFLNRIQEIPTFKKDLMILKRNFDINNILND